MDQKEYISNAYSCKNENRSIDSILAALNDEDIDPQLKRKMQAWFLGDFEDNPAKQDAFVRYADRIEPFTGKPDGDDLARYERLMARLGMKFIPVPKVAKPSGRRIIRMVRRIAAVAIPAVIIAGVWLMGRSGEPDRPEMMIAASDAVQSLYLPDSSFVSVNPGSTVFYHEDGDGARNVDLIGEAMFMVREDGGKRFSVATTSLTVNVRGTDFAVSEYCGASCGEVELYDGRVNVETGGVNTVLSRGEKLSYDLPSHTIDVSVIPADRMIEKGYKPRLKFEKATFREIITALAAFHEVEIEFAPGIDGDSGSVSGDIEDNTLESALNTILKMWEHEVAHRTVGEKIVIYRN